ncbi:acetate/propionate family kinase [Roseomonas gilardii]|uniref:acetate/propionate family kinase n=1 Tax=Roseomonas gilardii TaxID=257708 RepID=UPI000487F725|nr:acetate/propionate family kinase [Roseomonas gilardii]SUE63410.1 Acetate kinase [Roseomonas gilardii subsp. rosea]
MSETILILNAGSSSIKFQLYELDGDEGLHRRFKGQMGGIGSAAPRLHAVDAQDRVLVDEVLEAEAADTMEEGQAVLGGWLMEHLGGPPIAVGHRVVHGGPDFAAPVLVDDGVLEALEALVPLAPLHQPFNLAPIRSIRARRPDLPQVACFDTAFHRGHPEVAERFAIPESLYRQGVRRYGFHGLSYEFIARQIPVVAPELAGGRVVVAHLGNGASACAIGDGRSLDSTMGFTALDGLPMGTRPGSLDAGVVVHLAAQGMDAGALQDFLYHDCGLKGLSGLTSDMRELLASEAPSARLAIDYFCYHAAKAIAALATAMGGIDGIVFTAGVGENAAPVREAILRRCAWMGVEADPARNAAHGPLISTEASRLRAYVIPTNEERMIARHTLDVLRGRGGGAT